MSDVATSYKCNRAECPVSKSGDSATATRAFTSRKADGWTPGLSDADAIKFAQSESGIFRILCGVFGRRRTSRPTSTLNGDSR